MGRSWRGYTSPTLEPHILSISHPEDLFVGQLPRYLGHLCIAVFLRESSPNGRIQEKRYRADYSMNWWQRSTEGLSDSGSGISGGIKAAVGFGPHVLPLDRMEG